MNKNELNDIVYRTKIMSKQKIEQLRADIKSLKEDTKVLIERKKTEIENIKLASKLIIEELAKEVI